MNVKNFTVWLITGLFLLSLNSLSAQVGINETGAAPAASAMLDVVSTNKGVLVPRLTEAQKNAIVSPAMGLLIFQLDKVAGFYFFTGTDWQFLGAQGPVGPAGATGAQGEKGDKGETGDAGATGAQGEKGDKGDTGDAGATGAQGEKGDKGDTGDAGATGAQGEKGDKGDTGDAGATGVQGEKGDKGDTGDAGATGAQGEKGDKGDTGDAGADGGDDQTLSEVLAQGNIADDSIDMNTTKRIINLADPTMDQDAATKAYVDSKTTTSPTYTIGVNAALGGYVFYVTPNGKHGLVAANQDQSTSVSWYGRDDVLNDPANHDTAGKEFTDWRMPTKRELNLMYVKRTDIGAFSGFYWSSTEDTNSSGWIQLFPNGSQGNDFKNGSHTVRAVRAF